MTNGNIAADQGHTSWANLRIWTTPKIQTPRKLQQQKTNENCS